MSKCIQCNNHYNVKASTSNMPNKFCSLTCEKDAKILPANDGQIMVEQKSLCDTCLKRYDMGCDVEAEFVNGDDQNGDAIKCSGYIVDDDDDDDDDCYGTVNERSGKND